MATESKEGWTENTLAPKAKAQARGPPRWGAPIDISKITVTPAPPNLFEQLESLTSVMPMGEPAGEKSEAVGTGVGVTGAPGAKRAPVRNLESQQSQQSQQPQTQANERLGRPANFRNSVQRMANYLPRSRKLRQDSRKLSKKIKS